MQRLLVGSALLCSSFAIGCAGAVIEHGHRPRSKRRSTSSALGKLGGNGTTILLGDRSHAPITS